MINTFSSILAKEEAALEHMKLPCGHNIKPQAVVSPSNLDVFVLDA
jgi:hypothetical protein